MVLVYSAGKKSILTKVGIGLVISGPLILLGGVGGGLVTSPLLTQEQSGWLVYGGAALGTSVTVAGIVTLSLGLCSIAES